MPSSRGCREDLVTGIKRSAQSLGFHELFRWLQSVSVTSSVSQEPRAVLMGCRVGWDTPYEPLGTRVSSEHSPGISECSEAAAAPPAPPAALQAGGIPARMECLLPGRGESGGQHSEEGA